MKVLAITLSEEDIQVEKVFRFKSKCNLRVLSLNSLSRASIEFKKGHSVRFYFDGRIFNPDVIWFVTNIRTDSIFALGNNYPNEVRLTAGQFMKDLQFNLDCNMFPGSIDSMELAESKLFLFRTAVECGLNIPKITLNSSLKNKKSTYKRILYRKKLGYPTIISYCRKTKKEIVLTTYNSLGDQDSQDLLWQWQSPIRGVANIRCCLVGDRVFSVISRHGVNMLDIRSETDNLVWSRYDLPKQIVRSIIRLSKKLNIRFACPEFILDSKERLIFIDMNPCGDWYGFFDEETRKEIAFLILKDLKNLSPSV